MARCRRLLHRSSTILLAALLVLVALAGAAGAYHLSAGASDTAGTGSEETASHPTVDAEMRERGLVRDCYDPDADPDPRRAAAADGFCGRLLYHAGTEFEQASPSDQELVGEAVAAFDVVYANYVGTYGIGTCSPWCWPGGEAAYRSGHDAGAQLGLTPTGEEAYRADQGWQTYGGDVAHPNALHLAQTETEAWEANGWMQPMPDQSFVGFLEDDEGNPIDDERLQRIVAGHDGLPADAVPGVCGFTPDADLAGPGPSDACEVSFTWRGTSQEEAACGSSTYTCGALTPAWHAQIVCWPAHGCRTPQPGDGPDTRGDRLGPASSAGDYDVWHWVVAPSPSACSGLQEPGFSVEPDAGGVTYLAHDLDVYSPAGTVAGVDNARQAEAAVWTQLAATVDDAPASPDAGPVPLEPSAATLVAKDDRVEPNAVGDSSQAHVHVDRALSEDACATIRADAEEPAYVDPWVDAIDAQVYRNLWLDSILGVDPWLEGLERARYQQAPVTSVFGDANDAYGTGEADQDASNRPGPWMYSAGGKLGVFTDKDDDGRYDQAPNSRLFDAIDEEGAYPLFWDMRVDEMGAVDPDAGCRIHGERLTEAMAEAGYGSRTGLAMVVYKTEPTVLYDWRTSQTFPQPDAEQAYVLLSQALAAQRGEPAVETTIQSALDRLPAELSVDDDQVVFPGEWTAPASDFYEQCGYPTGGFHTSWSFTHAAHARGGDTLVTAYVRENTASDGVLGGSGLIPAFTPGDEPYAFDTGIQRWFDVDPLDGDPDRNTGTCSAPPHDGDRC